MPRITPLMLEDGYDDDDTKNFPPSHALRFTPEEFASFLANPVETLSQLGQTVKSLTVTVKDHVWDVEQKQWITDQPDVLFNLPTSSSYVYWCYYTDQMCVCEPVIVVSG
jgi:hypothetical protein